MRDAGDLDLRHCCEENPQPSRGFFAGGVRAPVAQSKLGDATPSTLCSFGLVVVYCN